jgi:hypothetical protein
MTGQISSFNDFVLGIKNLLLPDVFQLLVTLSPVVLAFILMTIFWKMWVMYVRAEFFFKQKYVLLDIRLPKETMKSPLAMELFLTALHQTGGEANWFDKYWLGKTRPWFSLELVSIEGKVSFHIWAREATRNYIESTLYAQFPGIEVHQVPDYALSAKYDPKTMVLWAAEMKLTKADPYPIKTYIDYKLDKDPKEEFKVDPIAPMVEYLGSIGANQQVWFQILVRAHKSEDRKAGHLWKTTDKWKDDAIAEVNKILLRDPKTKVAGEENEDGLSKRPSISKGEEEIVAAIERSVSKLGFDVGIRILYLAKKESFNGTNIPGMLGVWKQFNSENLNGFKPNTDRLMPRFSYPWQDFKEIRQNKVRREALDAYKRRSYFYDPHICESFVLNSEELATIFHFPGQVAQAPALSRITSKKSDAPPNLPI